MLLSAIDNTADDKLTGFVIRLALFVYRPCFGWRVLCFPVLRKRSYIHTDGGNDRFYDRQQHPDTQHGSLDNAIDARTHPAPEPARVRHVGQKYCVDQSIGFGL